MRLIAVIAIAAAVGGVGGFWLGLNQGADRAALADSYIGTAGHTKTYVSVASLVRKGQSREALKLLDAMINAGASRLAHVPVGLDDEARQQVEKSLAAVNQYRQGP